MAPSTSPMESVVIKAGDAVTIYLPLNQSHFFDAGGIALRYPERHS